MNIEDSCPPPSIEEPVAPPPSLEPTETEKTDAMICHLLGLAGYVIPLGGIIGPIIFWSMKKDKSVYVDQAGKEAINFHISMLIYLVISMILTLIFIGVFLAVAVLLVEIIYSVIVALKARDGIASPYPFSMKFI